MRILFDLQRTGYLRLYDTTIRLLVERGHEVHIGLRNTRELDEAMGALAGVEGGLSVGVLRPKRTDVWAPLAELLRQTVDYVRYFDARLEAGYLRTRIDELPPVLRPLRRIRVLRPDAVRRLLRALLAIERAIPSSVEVEALIATTRPEVVALTPLVKGLEQTDVIKSARALGIPTVLGVASWDHLTTKGMIREPPDRVLVWNEAQRAEAIDLHLIPEHRVTVTGAQPWDWWFEERAPRDREEFCGMVGLDSPRLFVLYAGSSSSIAPPAAERRFVRNWVAALRESVDPRVRDLGVLIRPHPNNADAWSEAGPPEGPNVAMWPRGGRFPMASDEPTRRDYFDSLFHCTAVVGINTSAMIEAAIVGRPVLTVEAGEFADTQGATLHFRHLLPENGGFVVRAGDLGTHLDQLAGALEHPGATAAAEERFLRSFVRPQGLRTPSAPRVADALERAPRDPVEAVEPRALLVLRALMWPVAVALRLRRDPPFYSRLRGLWKELRSRLIALMRLARTVVGCGKGRGGQ